MIFSVKFWLSFVLPFPFFWTLCSPYPLYFFFFSNKISFVADQRKKKGEILSEISFSGGFILRIGIIFSVHEWRVMQ